MRQQKKKYENTIPQIPRLGGDMKSRSSKILKRNTGVRVCECGDVLQLLLLLLFPVCFQLDMAGAH
jgi:hypothetical protein